MANNNNKTNIAEIPAKKKPSTNHIIYTDVSTGHASRTSKLPNTYRITNQVTYAAVSPQRPGSNNIYTTPSFSQKGNVYKGRRPPMKPPQEVIYGNINPIATQNAARTTKKTGYNNAEPTHQSLGDLKMKPRTVMLNVSTAANIAKKKQNTNLRKNGTPPVPPPRTRINNSSKQNKKPKGFFSKLFSKKAKQPKKTY